MLDGEAYERIRAVDALPPFLINLPTDTDLWMFVSSAGGLTAGRRDPDGALFPYETVDRLHDALHHTGPVTLVRARTRGRPPLSWEPLAPADAPRAAVERALAKNALGNRLVFEEIHHEAQLAFRYRWGGSDATGWVRTATLVNLGREPVSIALLDGLRNLLPSGAPLTLYQRASCLVDAYKRTDVDPETRLGIFSLTSKISDRPEPAEQLRASTAWCHGLPDFRVALSADALGRFRRGYPVAGERVLTGRRGCYLVTSALTLDPGASVTWHIAADAGRSHADIARLRARLLRPDRVDSWIEESLCLASENLRRIVGSADGLQLTGGAGDPVHHFANVLFNSLRGGVFVASHSFPMADFTAFLEARNRPVAARHSGLWAALPALPAATDVHRLVRETGDADLRRLCLEYLPLCFARRHGDPSRPWNRFAIHVRNADGSPALRYEGNWRDVFQNWEALTRSFPGFLPGMIAKFVNASTIDGFNPYRIAHDGIDWEVPDPEDPWSGIGYWGDHQVAYLLRFLESMPRHFPNALEEMLGQEIFCYADVPYRIAPYAEIVANPKSTIAYRHDRAATVARRVAAIGGDGKLVPAADGGVHHASLMEKLVVPALAKMSCFVPGGGIWMNTERPEWNDANNALAGHGLSVVTLCHLSRYLRFLGDLAGRVAPASTPVAREVAAWMRQVAAILERHRGMLALERVDDASRRRMMDALGGAFCAYRGRVYDGGFSGTTPLAAAEVVAWCRAAGDHVDHAIRANRRDDGLYHSYNLLELAADGSGAAVRHLDLMLEGQVAALGSGHVTGREAVALLSSLFASRLYRPDQNSFLLYPETALPGFLERNRIPEARAAGIPLVGELLAARDVTVVERDADGALRFHGDFATARDVAMALDALGRRAPWTRSVARDRQALLDLFEDVFEHRTFTGRSGRMYAYEGIGCIYWHMVAKLLLAVQEVTLRAFDDGDDAAEELANAYYRIRGGLGFEKTVGEFGAFPSDPYSHTPAHAGAQQPGLTGQVKEEILARFGELGVRVSDGTVAFDPVLLRRPEFLAEAGAFCTFDLSGAPRTLDVPAGSLAFLYCQVPVVYTLTPGEAWIRVVANGDAQARRAGCRLTLEESRALFGRTGEIARIDVGVPERRLFGG